MSAPPLLPSLSDNPAHPPLHLPPVTTTCLILGGAGFIGSHVARELRRHGRAVIVADKHPCAYFPESDICDRFVGADLRVAAQCSHAVDVAVMDARRRDGDQGEVWVFLFAADMGGMGYIESNESAILRANTAISVNTVSACADHSPAVSRLFVASSACVYPVTLQSNPANVPALHEDSAWPANPQDGYGLEKLYGEEVALRVGKSSPSLRVRVARFHNVYGPHGTWIGGREKAPAAFLRKVVCFHDLVDAKLEVWGNGQQQRTFCYIEDAVKGVLALMASDVTVPVNIGSSETVTITELALLAGEAAGFSRQELQSRLHFNPEGPIGVLGRSADLSRASDLLGWTPKVSLRDGLRLTLPWIRAQLDAVRVAAPQEWPVFAQAALTSTHARVLQVQRFALLVPVTSRHLGRGIETKVREFLASLRATIVSSPAAPVAWQYDLCFGVDADDAVCSPLFADAVNFVDLVASLMPAAMALGIVTVRVTVFRHAPGRVCDIWSDLATDAFASGADFAVLLGDDVVLQSSEWANAVWAEFERISSDTGLPFGFGCVAFFDECNLGFPTFPVLHRLHIDVFGADRLFPPQFVNQHADPFLFQVYRAFNAARLAPAARLSNTIGGFGDARYEKVGLVWSGQLLVEARDAAARYLARRTVPLTKSDRATLTFDVVVPTFRVPMQVLERILALDVPVDTSVQFIVVCDNPTDAAAQNTMEVLQKKYATNPMVRLRTNPSNLGAGLTRNRGLAESSADWVLFLDDDIEPQQNLLSVYSDAIRAHPRATGFVGLSKLPEPLTGRQAGVYISGCAFFWTVAECFPTATELPWGITANLCVRRPLPESNVLFSAVFPRTGGGEDIDFCLKLRQHMRERDGQSEGFVAVAAAVIDHPWWGDGVPPYRHFIGWAWGDGHLNELYADLTYYNLPNLTETLVVIGVAAVASMALWAGLSAHPQVVHLLPSLLRLPPHPMATVQRACILAAGCIAADLLFDAGHQLIVSPHPRCHRLPVATKLHGVAQALIIRTCSEMGRIGGQRSRGTLLWGFGRRFRWFGRMWMGAATQERKMEACRTVVRVGVCAVAVVVVRLVAHC